MRRCIYGQQILCKYQHRQAYCKLNSQQECIVTLNESGAVTPL
jgi:hypothetical protein